MLRTRTDTQAFVTQRRAGRRAVGAIIGIEGLHCLDGDVANIDRFFADGVRMAGLTHFFDNDLGGSAHGNTRGSTHYRFFCTMCVPSIVLHSV